MADKKTSSRSDDKPLVKAVPPRPDWEAVERDYRTGRFSLRELAVLHSANHATIGRRVEREGWTKDLTHAIRLATNAKLIEEETQQHCDSARQSATDVVLAAAETNRQIKYERAPAKGRLRIFGCSDYAVTPDGGDFTEHGIFGIDEQDSLYVLDWWYGQTSSDLWVEKQCDLIHKWQPICWGAEAGVIRRAVGQYLSPSALPGATR